MSRISLVALCLALSPSVLPFAAKADPRVLTPPELAAVTAGSVILPPIQINLNDTVQGARATAASIAICLRCTNATVKASSTATASNVNVAELTNAAFWVLTPSELAALLAGSVFLPPIQINVNNTVQEARATAASIAICSRCTNATVNAFSAATAFNVNVTELTNAAF
jgi:hypothetical protein